MASFDHKSTNMEGGKAPERCVARLVFGHPDVAQRRSSTMRRSVGRLEKSMTVQEDMGGRRPTDRTAPVRGEGLKDNGRAPMLKI